MSARFIHEAGLVFGAVGRRANAAPERAEAWFAGSPERAENVIPLAAAKE